MTYEEGTGKHCAMYKLKVFRCYCVHWFWVII